MPHSPNPITTLLFAASVLVAGIPTSAIAQITKNPNDAGTEVKQNGNIINIEDGTPTGANLFHSFDKFKVNQEQTVNFISNPAIQNIFGRVTGGEASVINGIIQVTGGNSNLYLMNPAGIIFGAGASLNVPAAFTATTANGIGFGDKWLNAVGTNNYASLSGNPTAFAFTQAGAIFNAGNLAVNAGQNLTLLGGTVVSTGTISAPGGNITIAAIPGEQLVKITPEGSLLSLALPVETKAAINPSTLTPLTLPQLLTGGNISGATGVTVENGVVKLTGADVNIGSGDVVVSTTGDITATYISANNGSIHLNTTGGEIKLGNPDDPATSNSIDTSIVAKNTLSATAKGTIQAFSQLRGNSVKLSSTGGNVIITTIDAGSGGVDIYAAGLFQARGAFTVTDVPVRANIKPSNDAELSKFLQARGIKFDPDKDITVSFSDPNNPFTPLIPASIRTKPDLTKPDVNPQAKITIRYGDATRTIVHIPFDIPIETATIDDQGLTTFTTIITNGKILIQGGNSSYYIGPAVSGKLLPNVDDPYITNVDSKFVKVTPQTFDEGKRILYPNATYSTTFPSDKFPTDGNGTVGALIVGGGSNTRFYDSLQTREFPSNPGTTTTTGTTGTGTGTTTTTGTDTGTTTTTGTTGTTTTTGTTGTGTGTTGTGTGTTGTGTDSIPDSQQQIVQRQINPGTNSDACNTSNTVAVNPQTTNGTNRDSSSRTATSSPSGSNNGCTPANNDLEILKIQYETPNFDQNKLLNFDSSHHKFSDMAVSSGSSD